MGLEAQRLIAGPRPHLAKLVLLRGSRDALRCGKKPKAPKDSVKYNMHPRQRILVEGLTNGRLSRLVED